jgi:hypothetical protein
MNPIFIALIALSTTMTGLVQYFRTIPKNTVREKPVLLTLFLSSGILISIYALLIGIPGSVLSEVGVVIPAVMPIFFGTFIL